MHGTEYENARRDDDQNDDRPQETEPNDSNRSAWIVPDTTLLDLLQGKDDTTGFYMVVPLCAPNIEPSRVIVLR